MNPFITPVPTPLPFDPSTLAGGGSAGIPTSLLSNPLLYVLIAFCLAAIPVIMGWANLRNQINQLRATNNEAQRAQDEKDYRTKLASDLREAATRITQLEQTEQQQQQQIMKLNTDLLSAKHSADDCNKENQRLIERINKLEDRRTQRDAQIAQLAALIIENNPALAAKVNAIINQSIE